MKLWLQTNPIEMYSEHNKENSVVAERFIKTSKNETYKHMTSTSKKCILINSMIKLTNTTIHIMEQ